MEQQQKHWPRHHQHHEQFGPDNNIKHPDWRAIWIYSRWNPKKSTAQKQHETTFKRPNNNMEQEKQ